MSSPPLASDLAPFPFLGVEHAVVLLGTAAIATGLILLLRRTAPTRAASAVRRTVCGSLAILLLAVAVVAQVQRLAAGAWSLRDSLPLHLCDINVFVTAAALLGAAGAERSGRAAEQGAPRPRPAAIALGQRLYELSYFWGLGGTLQSILTPDVDGRFPAGPCVRYFLLHGGIVVSVFVLTLGLRWRPQRGAVWRAWWTTLGLASVVAGLDALTGANYMFLCGPPLHTTLYDLFGPWPWALLSLALVATFSMIGLYSPFWLADRRTRHSGQIT